MSMFTFLKTLLNTKGVERLGIFLLTNPKGGEVVVYANFIRHHVPRRYPVLRCYATV